MLSPTNQVLLLHRVQTSSSFPSAHVFPGGNLDAGQDGVIPEPGSPDRHRDGPAYRLAAVRETFEEAGIVLARRKGSAASAADAPLVHVPEEERERARGEIHSNRSGFKEWLDKVGGVADVGMMTPSQGP